jgi:hypothetical protein
VQSLQSIVAIGREGQPLAVKGSPFSKGQELVAICIHRQLYSARGSHLQSRAATNSKEQSSADKGSHEQPSTVKGNHSLQAKKVVNKYTHISVILLTYPYLT